MEAKASNSKLKEQLESVNNKLKENEELIHIQEENIKLEKEIKKANKLLNNITTPLNICIYDTFIKDKIKDTPGSKVREIRLYEVFKIWYQLHHSKNIPKGRELFEFINKKFGRKERGVWNNISIIYDDYDPTVDEYEEE